MAIKIDYTIRLGNWLLVLAFIIMAFIAIKYDISQLNECNRRIVECWKTIGIYNKSVLNDLNITEILKNFTNATD
jgi:hypothetical protein